MKKFTLRIIVFLVSTSLVLGDDPDVSNENIVHPEEKRPSDVFERAVMERLRPELRERMHNFFRQESAQISDSEMREIFENTFDPQEQKEVEAIFTEVVQEQMEAILGDMRGNMGFDGETDRFLHHDLHDEDDYEFEKNKLESGNESAEWSAKNNYILEASDSSKDDLLEKSKTEENGEDEIINTAIPKDEF